MATSSKRKNDWKCDFCGKEKDTLYFLGKKQICEECKKKLKSSNGHSS